MLSLPPSPPKSVKSSNSTEAINLYPGKTDIINATLIWDVDNINIPKKEDIVDTYDNLLKLQDIYNIAINNFIIVGSSSNMKQEDRDILANSKNIIFQDTKNSKPNKADIDIINIISTIAIERYRFYHIFILISGDKDFIGTLTGLRTNPLHKSILIHINTATPELLNSADETIYWNDYIYHNKITNKSEFIDSLNTSSDDNDRPEYGYSVRFISNMVEKFIAPGSLRLELDNIVDIVYTINNKQHNNVGRVISTYVLDSDRKKSQNIKPDILKIRDIKHTTKSSSNRGKHKTKM